MTVQEKLLQTARAELGYLEKASNKWLDDKTANAGSGNWTKYARDLDNLGYIFNGKKNGYDWCAVFVIWCFVRTFGAETAMQILGLPQKSLAAGVRYLAQYFKNAGRFYTKDPQPADVIFFYGANTSVWAHTGIVEKIESGRVYTIEGNTSGASGVVANGGGVADKSYALTYSKIACYGRPDWSLLEKEDDDMTGKEIYEKLCDYLQTLPAPDWADKELGEAIDAGITDGSDPMGIALRYQAAIMAKRAAKSK